MSKATHITNPVKGLIPKRKNPFLNGFFLLLCYGFLFCLLVQFLSRSIQIACIQTASVSMSDAIDTHYNGLIQDLSVSSYFTIILLIGLLFLPIKGLAITRYFQWFQGIVMSLTAFICLIDSQLMYFWNSKVNAQAIGYLQFPKQLFSSTTGYQLTMLCVVMCFVFALAFFSAKFFKFVLVNIAPNFLFRWRILFALPLLVIGIRGGFGKYPLSLGASYYSTNNILNLLATNSLWNAGFVLDEGGVFKQAKIAILDTNIEQSALQKYTYLDTMPTGISRIPRVLKPNSNVLIVILEGFGAHWTENRDHRVSATPNLNRLGKEGIVFTKAYASGDRTDKALVSIFSAWPGQPWYGLLIDPSRWNSVHLETLPQRFAKHKYTTQFFYGGDAKFINMESYLRYVGFSDIQSYGQERNSVWGKHDKPMLVEVVKKLKLLPKPFFASWLTLSSHEPYDIVENRHLDEKEKLYKSIAYTDEAIGQLVASLKKENLYDSTLLIFVGDHGKIPGLPISTDYEQEFFRIPLLFTGGAVNTPYRGIAPELVVNQTDIFATIASQIIGEDTPVPFSRNVFHPSHPGNSLSFANDKAVYTSKDKQHVVFLQKFSLATPLDSLLLGLQSNIIRRYFSK